MVLHFDCVPGKQNLSLAYIFSCTSASSDRNYNGLFYKYNYSVIKLLN